MAVKSMRRRLLGSVPLFGIPIFGNPLIQSQLLNAGNTGGVNWLFLDLFTTAESAPLSSPRTTEPGPGELTIVDTANRVSIVSTGQRMTGASVTAWTDPLIIGRNIDNSGFDRVCGRTFFFDFTSVSAVGTLGHMIGWRKNETAGLTNMLHAMYASSTTLFAWDGDGAVNPSLLTGMWVAGTKYEFALRLRNTGADLFMKIGGAWTLMWTFTGGTDTPLFLSRHRNETNNTTDSDNWKVRDLPAPFNTDNGLAYVNKTSFTQVLGSELFSNPNFSEAWVSGDPPGWTEYNETGTDPEITEVAPANTHGGGGTGAANIYSSSAAVGLYQIVLTANKVYEFGFEITARVSGTFGLYPGGSDSVNYSVTAVGVYKRLARSKTGGPAYMPYTAGATDFTEDNMTVKEITLNAAQTMPADAMIDYEFTLPASPVAGQQISLNYRINASGEELYNCWDAYLERNAGNTAWDFKLDSIATGTRTNRINVTGVGNVTRIRVVCNGNNHDCYTLIAGVWTKRGGTITNSTYATAVLANTIATSGFTESLLLITPLTNVGWNGELNRAS